MHSQVTLPLLHQFDYHRDCFMSASVHSCAKVLIEEIAHFIEYTLQVGLCSALAINSTPSSSTSVPPSLFQFIGLAVWKVLIINEPNGCNISQFNRFQIHLSYCESLVGLSDETLYHVGWETWLLFRITTNGDSSRDLGWARFNLEGSHFIEFLKQIDEGYVAPREIPNMNMSTSKGYNLVERIHW